MIKKRRIQLIRSYWFGDIISIILAFQAAFYIRFDSGLLEVPKGIPEFRYYLLVIPVLIFVHMSHFSSQGYYKIKLRRNRLDDLFLVVVNSIYSSVAVLLLFSYLKSYRFVNFEVSHFFLAVYIPCAVILIFFIRLLLFKIFRTLNMGKNGISRILIAGDGELADLMGVNLKKYSHFGIEVTGFLRSEPEDGMGGYDDLESVVKEHGITDLFIALPLKEYSTIMKLIEKGNNLLLDIRLVPDILQIASLKAGMEHIEGLPTIALGDIPLQGYRQFFKRALDIVASFLGLVILSPLFIFLAALVKFTSRGPVFYSQVRVGLDGRHFRMFKFRTMYNNAEKNTGAIWSPKDDRRVTRPGRLLRKYSIDELPQLFNVFIGDMTLVGPRPERPELVEKFVNDIPRYMLRHRVKTGMTGWAQVHGLRGNTSLEKRIELDIYYIQNWTFRLDLEILWRTILKFQFVDRSE